MAHIVTARRGKLISESGFAGYTHCYNPYVGCEYGCTYCYVRFFIRDQEHNWGDWVRVRQHALEPKPKSPCSRLEEEAIQIGAAKLVIGTMTDPYQPAEAKQRLTRQSLRILADTELAKVGIFTRSPLVMRDLDVIRDLPKGRVHLTITPFDPDLLKKLEPKAIKTAARKRTAEKIKEAGVRLHINVAPAIPIISDAMLSDLMDWMTDIKVDEFFVDPMQPYNESYEQVRLALQDRPEWPEIDRLMSDKELYKTWKEDMNARLIEMWHQVRHKSPETMAIACDHESKLKLDMTTGTVMNWATYDDYELARGR